MFNANPYLLDFILQQRAESSHVTSVDLNHNSAEDSCRFVNPYYSEEIFASLTAAVEVLLNQYVLQHKNPQ